MNYVITHTTVYEYSEAVTVSHHAARLKPRMTEVQDRQDFTLRILPEPSVWNRRTDYFGNRVAFFGIQEIHRRLEIKAVSRVSVKRQTPPVPGLSPEWEKVADLFRDPVSPEVVEPYQYCFSSPLLRVSMELADYAAGSFKARTPLLTGVLDLTKRIYKDFKYDPVATTVATPLEMVLKHRRGVCQDFAHLAVASLRSLGLPARYVSGYLRTHAAPGKARLLGADASHAWFSIFCPSVGWIDFDPTNNLMPAEEHITVAYGRDFSDVSPVSGIITGGGQHEVKVSVDVAPVAHDAPTVA